MDEESRPEERVRPLKRLKLRGQDGRLLNSGGSSTSAFALKTPKPEPGTVPESSSRLLSNGNAVVDKGKKPASPEEPLRGRRSISDRTQPAVVFREPAVGPGASPLSKNKTPHAYPFITPKDEPVDEVEDDYTVPLSMILPGN